MPDSADKMPDTTGKVPDSADKVPDTTDKAVEILGVKYRRTRAVLLSMVESG